MCMLLLLYRASKDFTTIVNQKHKNNEWIMSDYFSFNISQVRFIFSFLYSGFLKIVYCSDPSESQHDI